MHVFQPGSILHLYWRTDTSTLLPCFGLARYSTIPNEDGWSDIPCVHAHHISNVNNSTEMPLGQRPQAPLAVPAHFQVCVVDFLIATKLDW